MKEDAATINDSPNETKICVLDSVLQKKIGLCMLEKQVMVSKFLIIHQTSSFIETLSLELCN
jgi:hypothetical protein